jgi:hypothetical protein
MRRKPLPSRDRILEVLEYDPVSGIFRWRVSVGRVCAGSVAGGKGDPKGYLGVRIDGIGYSLHRLAWKIMTGEEPPEEVDHRDLCTRNNAWSNLRAADVRESRRHTGMRKNNTSGYKGVHRYRDRWGSKIVVEGREIRLGSYDTPEEASEAYQAAASRYFGEFAGRATL